MISEPLYLAAVFPTTWNFIYFWKYMRTSQNSKHFNWFHKNTLDTMQYTHILDIISNFIALS
jgi:hypothetical protein